MSAIRLRSCVHSLVNTAQCFQSLLIVLEDDNVLDGDNVLDSHNIPDDELLLNAVVPQTPELDPF